MDYEEYWDKNSHKQEKNENFKKLNIDKNWQK
jgi:hypothetical protein